MPAGYLFREISQRIAAYEKAHPAERVISLGIGDVTRPLPETVTRAMADAALEMSTPAGFRGYGPENGYDFLLRAICKNLYEPRGVTLGTDEVFISDGAKTDTAALQELLAVRPGPVMERFKIRNGELQGEELLQEVCRGRGFLLKGGNYDYDRCCQVVLDEFRAGKCGRISLEVPEG